MKVKAKSEGGEGGGQVKVMFKVEVGEDGQGESCEGTEPSQTYVKSCMCKQFLTGLSTENTLWHPDLFPHHEGTVTHFTHRF